MASFPSPKRIVPLAARHLRCASFLLFLVPLIVFSPSDAWSARMKLVVWGLPSRDASDPGSRANLAILDAYRAAHPGVDLRAFEGLNIPGVTTMDAGPLMAMAGGTAPDVMYVNFRISDTYIQQNFLYPLDEYMDDLKEDTGGDLSGIIPPQVWPVIHREGPDGKEHTWAIPYDLLVMALQYRKDLFKKAGLDPDVAPKNWDEFYDACMRITDPGGKVWGLGIATGSNVSAWNFMNFLWSAGGDAVAQDKSGVWRAVWDTPEAITAVKYYRKLRVGPWTKCTVDKEPVPFEEKVDTAKCKKCGRTYSQKQLAAKKKLYKGVISPTGNYGLEWSQGKIGFMFGYLGDQTLARGMDPNIIGIAAVPKGPTGISGSEVNCPMYGINSTITDKSKRDAVWDFIRFFCSEESRRIRTQAFVESGFAKYCNPKWLEKFGYSAYLREVPKGWFETFEESLKHAKPEPYGRNCQLIYNELSRPLDECVLSLDPDIDTIMKRECARTNEKLLGIIPPDVQKFRNVVTFFIVVFMALSFFFLLRYTLQTHMSKMQTDAVGETLMAAKFHRRHHLTGWLIVAPALISIALWSYFPLMRGSLMAFQDYKIVGETTWVGLENFSNAFFNADFWMTMKRTVLFAGLSLSMGFCAPIILALMLHEIPRFKVLFRTLYYLPAVTTGLVIMLLWKQFYMPGESGSLNHVLLKLQAIKEPKDWLNDFLWVMPSIILPAVWASVGPGCIIYLAALRAIPEELYEASDLDGGGFFQKFTTITIPYLKILIIINFVGAFVGAFKASENILIMTGGGPSEASKVLGLEIFYNAYMYLKFGYAVSMAWVLGFMLIGFTVFQLRILSNIQFKTASASE